ncbi:Het-C-domain-containing protein [Hortaea werneckii]|uniref:Het-C-domain-containing protein n=1 Tax=Hortaea werneckii TaxID=91943 RepID=A0A3M7CLF2_HORWE|nr:Het-C-domain-containing protein [Hortaea werneckii]KAI7678935.1 Het-C-domain-containing protein [Hortaea werneckii]KAI7713834.1 Het-C-domain-containing protein [Hortaea werneckii]RMY52931.1 hypothetical protein D0864_14185 [Hortaea werneckii]
MAFKGSTLLPLVAVLILCYATQAHAFGAGNIASTSKIEGSNWRHGDIEDTLLTLLTARAMGGRKFSKLDVKRVYFGNWLRDYSQAVDVGTVKYVSAEAIRLLLWILGFMSFGFGTGEFEVTSKRLGCYRPEEHIDNPKDYAENEDATQYDERLRGPVDEEAELSVDERTGMKRYIATEDADINTSAGLVRKLFGRSIQLGRRYKDSGDERDFYEALRLMGTACHCLEDYSAHSNYTELALIELGERGVFPHVGRNTRMELPGVEHEVYPIVTGTFGGVDFLHSVMGEFSDKATQSELQELEGTLQQSQQADTSMLGEILDKLPSGLLGGDDKKHQAEELQAHSQSAQMQNMTITPKEPEAFTEQMEEISKQIYPILEFHDGIMKSITEAIDKVPVLPDLIEELQNQVSLFVFSLLAPFVMPIIKQVQEELRTGSSEVIQSSKEKQLIVFHDDDSSDPTHSMLSKDHFSNVLNEPAGKVASKVIEWVVPQIVQAWDDEDVEIPRTLDRIVTGVLHHPAQRAYGRDGAREGRNLMFEVVERWWTEELSDDARDELREQLSREGVREGKNHKEGVEDSGHGCGKPLGLPSKNSLKSGAGGGFGGLNQMISGGGSGGSSSGGGGRQNQMADRVGDKIGEAVGGGALGSIVGGLAGNFLGGLGGGGGGGGGGDGDDDRRRRSDSNDNEEVDRTRYERPQRYDDGSYGTRVTETAHRYGGGGSGRHRSDEHEQYEQSQYERREFPSGGAREDFARYEQYSRDAQGGGYGFEDSREQRPLYDGGYEERRERRFEEPGGYERRVYEDRERDGGYGGRVRRASGGYEEGYRGEDAEFGGGGGYAGGGYGDGGGYASRGGYGQPPVEDEYERRNDDYERRYGGGGGGGYGGGNGGYGGGYQERRW